MRFSLPQFIEHEAKVIGPLTLRQFVYLGGAGAICFVLYYTAPFFIFLLSVVFLGGLGAALAFLKIGGLSLPTVLFNALKFTTMPKLYVWRKTKPRKIIIKEDKEPILEEKSEDFTKKPRGESRLKKLSDQIGSKFNDK